MSLNPSIIIFCDVQFSDTVTKFHAPFVVICELEWKLPHTTLN